MVGGGSLLVCQEVHVERMCLDDCIRLGLGVGPHGKGAAIVDKCVCVCVLAGTPELLCPGPVSVAIQQNQVGCGWTQCVTQSSWLPQVDTLCHDAGADAPPGLVL